MSRVIRAILIIGLLVGAGGSAAFGQPGPITGVEELTAMLVPDCDGLAVGDLNGDGTVDLLTSSGAEGEVFWFEQKTGPTDWQRHSIYTEATEVEGNDLADFDGDGQLEAISLDQEAGEILLHRPVDDPRGTWKTAAIQSERGFVQASLATDVDGDERPELVYTWEGTEPGSGGVHWLDFKGGAVLDPDAWTDHTMVTHESAWWIAPHRIDANGDGRAREVIYTARNLQSRNAGARPGLFWAEPASGPAARWTRHAIDTSLTHPLHVDGGQFSAQGKSRDLIVGGFEIRQLHVYTWADSWRRHALDLPEVGGKTFNEIWNVKAIPIPERKRDAMLAVLSRPGESAMVLFQHRKGQYRSQVVRRMSYTHPMDDRLILRDLTKDGRLELIVADSGGGELAIFRFEGAN